MAIGDTPNQNLFGTNYNAEEEEKKKAELAAQNAMMGAGSPTGMGAATPASTFGQEPASNPFSVQVFEDPSFKTPNFDAIPQTPEQERRLQIHGQKELNEMNRDAFVSGMVGQREGFEKPMSFQEIQYAKYDAASQDFVSRYLTNALGEKFKNPLNARIDKFASAISRENRDLNKFTNTFAQPNSPQANFLTRMETGEALSPQEIQDASALAASMGTTFDPKTGYSREAFGEARNAELNPPMTGLRPVDPRTGEFLSQDVIAAGENAGLTFPSQVSVPMQQAPQAPIAPMGQEETRAALGGMTLNEYLNAPAGTEGVSGLRTDPQGRMITPSAQPPVDSAVPSATTQPPVDALSSFEQDSLSRQQRIGGTGSFEGDSEAREAKLREMDRRPGESQADRDTRVAQSKTTGGQTGGLSFDDARRRAEGQLAARGVKNPSASQVNALARGIQAGEPERLAELETKRAKDAVDLKTAQATLNRPEFEGRVYTVNGVTFAQTSRGGAQVIDTGTETSEESTAKMKDFVFALEQIDKARKAYQAGDIDKANDIITAAGIQKNGFDVTASEYFGGSAPSGTASGLTEQQEANIQKVLAANPGSKRADVIEAMQKKGKL